MAKELVNCIQELHPIINLINLIIKAASTARSQNRVCREFKQWLETIVGLLQPLLENPGIMKHPPTREALKQLEVSLEQAHQLVIKYKDRSYPYRFIMGADIVEKFRVAQKNIKNYLKLVPLITLFVNETIQRVDTHCQDKEEEDQKKDGGRDKEKDTKKENGREEDQDRRKGKDEKDEKMKNVPLLVETAVLKVGMHCECNGCYDNIKRSIHKYPGVKKVVTNMHERILSVTVEGDFDAKMLREYIAKNTKKEVDLVGDGGWERDDHQVLEKTGKDNKSISGGGKPEGGNKNKKRVVSMIPATVVVLKVGGTGLRCDCNGCMDQIRNNLSKIRGVQRVDIDVDKSQVSVTGTGMDTAILQETLSKKVRRAVEVVPPVMTDGQG